MLYIMAHSSRDTKTQTDRDARRLRYWSLQITLFTK